MLSTDKIKDLLSHGENKQVEFKRCTDKVSASVYETVCSFLNAEGGYIFWEWMMMAQYWELTQNA